MTVSDTPGMVKHLVVWLFVLMPMLKLTCQGATQPAVQQCCTHHQAVPGLTMPQRYNGAQTMCQ